MRVEFPPKLLACLDERCSKPTLPVRAGAQEKARRIRRFDHRIGLIIHCLKPLADTNEVFCQNKDYNDPNCLANAFATLLRNADEDYLVESLPSGVPKVLLRRTSGKGETGPGYGYPHQDQEEANIGRPRETDNLQCDDCNVKAIKHHGPTKKFYCNTHHLRARAWKDMKKPTRKKAKPAYACEAAGV